jgi:predicted membrane GTPase involved in stress response
MAKLTNVRASGTDEAVRLTTPIKLRETNISRLFSNLLKLGAK